MIRNIIFDIGNVLVGYDWQQYLDSFRFPAEKRDAIARAVFGSDTWNELDRGIVPIPELEERFAANAPRYRTDILRVFRSCGKCILRRDYAIPWIQDLKKRGFHVYYLSNYSEFMIAQTRSALDFIPYMDGGVFSCEVKQIKPDPEIFYSLLKRCPSIRPDESIFFDDTEKNTQAACTLGFHGIVFRDKEQAEADLKKLTGDAMGPGSTSSSQGLLEGGKSALRQLQD